MDRSIELAVNETDKMKLCDGRMSKRQYLLHM